MEQMNGKSLIEAKFIARIVANYGATKVDLLDVQNKSQEFNFVILASLPSIQANKVLCSNIKEKALEKNIQIRDIDGDFHGEWIVIDFNDFVVHLLLENIRTKFNIDKLWKTSKNQLKY